MQGEQPIAWSFELARSIDHSTEPPTYCDWGKPRLSFTEPCVPVGSIRNLTPLYAKAQQPLAADVVERVALAMGAALVRNCTHRGECRAWADEKRSGEDNILAEVDGEIDLEMLARAALEALGQSSEVEEGG